MKLREIFKKDGLVDKITGIVDKAVPDKEKAAELKMELIKVIASVQGKVAPYVRAVIAVQFMTVWLWFPEKFANRSESERYVLYGIIGFYFLADFTIDKWRRSRR